MKKTILGGILFVFSMGRAVYGAEDIVICTQQYEPVCGTNGQTYGNLCMAQGADIAHEGECKTTCTEEYAPVCGAVQVQCVTFPCEPVRQTFDNHCKAQNHHATDIIPGTCEDIAKDPLIQDILRGYDHQVTRYKNPTDYRPHDRLIREEATKMITATLAQAGIEIPYKKDMSCAWTDEKTIDPTLIQFVRQSCQQGLFRGGDDGRFMPKQPIEYRQMDIVLERLAGLVGDSARHLPTFDFATPGPITRGHFISILHRMFDTYQANHRQSLQSDLTQAQALRKSKGSTSYTITQTKSCFCMRDYVRPMTYDVIDGSTRYQNAIYADDQKPVTVDIANTLLTIDQAFAMIQKAIDTNADKISVTYDTTYGYPTQIFIDQSFMMADEEMRYTYKLHNTPTSPVAGDYTLTMFNGKKAPTDLTLTMGADTIHAQICNTIRGPYTTTDDRLIWGAMMSTRMACTDQTLTTIESAFASLSKPHYTLTNTTLTLTEGDNTFVFTKQ